MKICYLVLFLLLTPLCAHTNSVIEEYKEALASFEKAKAELHNSMHQIEVLEEAYYEKGADKAPLSIDLSIAKKRAEYLKLEHVKRYKIVTEKQREIQRAITQLDAEKRSIDVDLDRHSPIKSDELAMLEKNVVELGKTLDKTMRDLSRRKKEATMSYNTMLVALRDMENGREQSRYEKAVKEYEYDRQLYAIYEKKYTEAKQEYLDAQENLSWKESLNKWQSEAAERRKLLVDEIALLVASVPNQDKAPPQSSADSIRDSGVVFSGEYLLWRAWQDGLDYVGVGKTFPGTIKDPEFSWESGYRFGAGAYVGLWTGRVNYTRLSPKGGDSAKGNLFFTNLPQFVASGTNVTSVGALAATTAVDTLRTAQSRIDLRYKVLDIEALREISLGDRFVFHLLFGLRGVRIWEQFRNDYSGLVTVTEEEFSPVQVTVDTFDFTLKTKDRWRFAGGGLRFGGDGELNIKRGLFFAGEATIAVLYGRYKNRYSHNPQTVGTTGTIDTTPEEGAFKGLYTVNGIEGFDSFKTNLELGFAIGWKKHFSNGSYFALSAGYDLSYWINLSQFRRGLSGDGAFVNIVDGQNETMSTGVTNSCKDPESVGFHGLTVKAELKF